MVWAANGPSYDSGLPQPVIGQDLNGVTNITTNTNGKAYGARLRFYPLPLDSKLDRLKLGASTYNGKWQNGCGSTPGTWTSRIIGRISINSPLNFFLWNVSRRLSIDGICEREHQPTHARRGCLPVWVAHREHRLR